MSNQWSKFFGNPILFSVLTSFVIFLSAGCLTTDQTVDRNANKTIQVDTDLPSGGDLIEIDLYEFADEDIGNLIKEISSKSGLTLLENAGQPTEFEFRIWTSLGGLADPRLLGVHLIGGESNAYFLEIDRYTNKVKSRRDKLANPKSGWNKMLFEFRSRLTTPKGLVRDPQFQLSRDEHVILLEVLDKGEYRRVLFGQNTAFTDGKRLIAVCEYLATEFDTDMICNGERQSP